MTCNDCKNKLICYHCKWDHHYNKQKAEETCNFFLDKNKEKTENTAPQSSSIEMNRYIVNPENQTIIGMLFKNADYNDEYIVTGGDSDDFIIISATSPKKAIEKLQITQLLGVDVY